MPNINQVQRGMVAFIDREIAPKLTGLTRVIVAGGGGVLASKLPTLLNNPSSGGIMGVLVDGNGEVDVETIYKEFKRVIEQEGSITTEIPIPFGAPLSMTLRAEDIDKLYQYIIQA